MAERLLRYYEWVGKEKGLGAKIALAAETRVPSTSAGTVPDSPEKLKLFREAAERIIGKPAPNF